METKYKIKGLFAKIRADLQTELMPCLNRGKKGGGYFSIPLIIFSFIEYLGILWKNPPEKDKRTKKRMTYYTQSKIEASKNTN